MIPVPIIDKKTQTDSYMHSLVDRLYIALNFEMYIIIRQQEIRPCKITGYEFYCEELFIVKYKSKYSNKMAMYFNLDTEIIMENSKFAFYYTKTDITTTVFDGGNEIILANCSNDKYIICSINNNIPVRIPSHLYFLVNKSVLCNCSIDVKNNFLLESVYQTQECICLRYTGDITRHLSGPCLYWV